MAEPAMILNIFPESMLNYFRLYTMINTDGLSMLHQIFHWAYKGGSDNVHQYLKSKYSGNIIKSIFNTNQLRVLKNYQSFQEFDITLIYVLFQTVCGLEAKPHSAWKTDNLYCIESILYSIKQNRNSYTHTNIFLTQNEMISQSNILLNKYIHLINKAGICFQKTTDEITNAIDEIEKRFSKTRDLSVLDTARYTAEVLQFNNYINEIIKTKGADELRRYYDTIKLMKLRIWPLQYKGFQVKDFFTPQDIISDDESEVITEKTVLTYKSVDGTIPSIVISGNAGAGKTTLLKLLLEMWCDKCECANEFDLVFYVDCRNCDINSIDKLLFCLLPKTFMEVKQSEIKILKTKLLEQNVLFLIDGIDEANANALKLLKELFKLNSNSLRFICATRPYRLDELSILLSDANRNVKHLTIPKVPSTKWMSFVDKLLSVTMEDLPRKEARDRIYLFLRAHDNNLWGIDSPFLLTCIAVLGAEDYELGAFTSKSEIYLRIEDLISEKIAQWIITNVESKDFDRIGIKNKCSIFLKNIDEFAYKCFSSNTFTIDKPTKQILAQTCRNLALPENETLSAFLNCKSSLTNDEDIYNYTFHHKSILEYHAANYVVQNIKLCGMSFLDQVVLDENVDNSALLSFVVELLRNDNCLKKNSEVFVSIAKKIGVTSIKQWLELMTNEDSAKYFSPFVAKLLQPNNMIEWIIKDNQIPALYYLLNHTYPKSLQLIVSSLENPLGIPYLKEVIELIAKLNIQIELYITYHYVTYRMDHSDMIVAPILGNINCECKLQGFRGSLTSNYIITLPSTLTFLTIRTNYDQITALHQHLNKLNNLETLEIHLDIYDSDTDSNSLPTLELPPSVDKLFFALPRITNDNYVWGAEVIAKVFKQKYFKIKLFDSFLTAKGADNMLQEMVRHGVQVSPGGWFEVRTIHDLNEEENLALQSYAMVNGLTALFWRVQ